MKEPEVAIKSVSQIGEVEIVFSQPMELENLFEDRKFHMQDIPPYAEN